jgi:hypothetical protein
MEVNRYFRFSLFHFIPFYGFHHGSDRPCKM